MIRPPTQLLRRALGSVAIFAALGGYFAATEPAYSRVWIGFGVPYYAGPPAYYPPPVYYPPPAYYPPPMSYAPSYAPAAPSTAGQSCYAGPYVCPMDRPVPSGAACYCLGNGGARVWGRAN
jgi:hypothetical protein